MEVFASINLQKPALPLANQSPNSRDSSHWNSIIKHQTKLKDDEAILITYTQMQSKSIYPDKFTLPLVLKACAKLQAVEAGKKIHGDIKKNTTLIEDVRVQTALVDFYCKCGMLKDALDLFDEMTERDVVSWNAMISGYVGCGCYEEALLLFREMEMVKMRPNSVTAVALLSACGELLELKAGKEIHGYCLRNGLFDCNVHVGTALLGFYSRFGANTSRNLFETMSVKNVVSWNAMISGYFDTGDPWGALELFVTMIADGSKPDVVTMLIAIQACAEVGCLQLGMQIHQLAIKYNFVYDAFIVNSLLHMYGKYGNHASLLALFESTPRKDVVLWNAMISSCVEIGSLEEAVSLYNRMQSEGVKEDERTIAILLTCCLNLEESGLRFGKSLHAYAIKCGVEKNTSAGNAFLNMYAELNCIQDAFKVFSNITYSDVVSWNTLILALAENGFRVQAWKLFEQMQHSDILLNSHTIISILASCDNESFLNFGRCIHGYVLRRDIEIGIALNTALTEMYMNCNKEPTAEKLFEGCSNKDVISWNSFIASYIRNNKSHKAFPLFCRMLREVKPNPVTIINVLSSCTQMANLPQGKCLHAYAIRRETSWGFDLSLANAFLTMYARCGNIKYAEDMFRNLPKRNIVSWNAMIDGYGIHGRGDDALLAFSEMVGEGLKPNDVTFISALSACSHSGLLDRGLQLFHSMVQDFGITPELIHYGCVVDLLGRAGRVDEAKEFITLMPIAPDPSVLRALLSGCRVYSKVEIAKTVSAKLIELEPKNAGNYILLSNIYAAAGLWSEVKKLRVQLEEKGLKKPAGKSWIAIRNNVNCFTAGDKSHPESDKIYEKLRSLLSSVRVLGYVPDLSWVLHEEGDEEKMKRLFSHSEKLAIAFGLISMTGGTAISIAKNLRVCGDCHEFGKYVSKLVDRVIVLRDGSRFHHFRNGVCSCNDYW